MADQSLTQSVNYSLKAIEISLTSITAMSDIIYKALKLFEGNKSIKAMNELVKNGETEFVRCDIDEMETLRRRLESKGVGMDAEKGIRQEGVLPIVTRGNDGKTEGMLVFNSKYHDIVIKEMTLFHAERQGGIVTSKFLENYGEGLFKEVSNLSNEELMLFDKECKNYHIPYCVDGPTNGQYTIRFASRDTDEMERVKMNASIIMGGKSNSLYRRQLAFENKSALDVRSMILNGKDKENNPIEKGTVVVSRDGKKVTFSANAIECFDETGGHLYKRTNSNFRNEANVFITRMDRPVILNKEQYIQYKSEMNKDDYLNKIECKNGKPQLSSSEIVTLAKENRQRELVESRLCRDHDQIMKVEYTDYDLERKLFGMNEKEIEVYEKILSASEVDNIDEETYSDINEIYNNWNIDESDKTPDEMILEDDLMAGEFPQIVDIEEDNMIDNIAEDTPLMDDMDH